MLVMQPIFTGTMSQHDKFLADNGQEWREHLRQLRDKRVEVIVRPRRSQRSLDQNAYWWAVPVRLLAEHCGYTDSQMHYALLGECFGYKAGPFGEAVPNVPSSSDLNTEQFTKLIEWVLTWGPTEMDVDIPPPGKVDVR